MISAIKTILFLGIIIYLIALLYPFYQRYWASITYGKSDEGKQFVKNLETIAYGLSFDEAQELADYLHTPVKDRKESPQISGAWVTR